MPEDDTLSLLRGFTTLWAGGKRCATISVEEKSAPRRTHESSKKPLGIARPFKVAIRAAITGEIMGSVQVLATESAASLHDKLEEAVRSRNAEADLHRYRFIFGGCPLPTRDRVARIGLIPGSIIQAVRTSVQAATCSWDGTAKIWCLESGSCVATLGDHKTEVVTLATSPEGKVLVTGCEDGFVHVWNLVTGSRSTEFVAHQDSVCSLHFAPKGGAFASGSLDSVAKIWELDHSHLEDKPECFSEFQCAGPMFSAMFSPDCGMLATGSADGETLVWAVGGSRPPLTRFLGHDGAVLGLAFAPDGLTVATVSQDHSAKIWRPKTQPSGIGGKAFLWGRWVSGAADPLVLRGHTDAVNAAAFFPDGLALLTASSDCSLRIWDSITGECQQQLMEHQSILTSVAFALSGEVFVSSDSKGILHVWNHSGRCLKKLQAHDECVGAVAFLHNM